MTQAVILAGGKGTRLAERLQGRPKPLVMVDGVPLLERQILLLKSHGVDEFVVLVNHAAEQIEQFIASRNFGVRVHLVDDGEPRGTSGAVLACLDMLRDEFLVVYGDTLFDLDVSHILERHRAVGADLTLLLHPNDHPADSDLVELDDAGRVTQFHGYPHPAGRELRNLVNAAFYVVNRKALEPWRQFRTPSDFGKDLFPAMLDAGAHLHGYVSFEYIKDLGTPKRLDKVEMHLRTGLVERASRRRRQKAVFLDRDGTLNELRDYVRRPEDLVLLPGASQAIRKFNAGEYRVVVVTNQPVLARGECSFETLREIHNRMESELGEQGAYIDALYFCPHHPHSGYPGEVAALKKVCECRKPEIGMIRSAESDLNIDAAQSWMIGDSTSDLVAARRAHLRSILVETGEGGRDGKWPSDPDFVCADIQEAAVLIVDTYPRLAAAMADVVRDVQPHDVLDIVGDSARQRAMVAGVLRTQIRSAKGEDWCHAQGAEAPLVGIRQDGSLSRDTSPGSPGRVWRIEMADLHIDVELVERQGHGTPSAMRRRVDLAPVPELNTHDH